MFDIFFIFILITIPAIVTSILLLRGYYQRKKQLQKDIKAFEEEHPVPEKYKKYIK